MMKHGLDVIRKAVLHINLLQTPVVACDQPLYAIAKQIQWTYPEQFGLIKSLSCLGDFTLKWQH